MSLIRNTRNTHEAIRATTTISRTRHKNLSAVPPATFYKEHFTSFASGQASAGKRKVFIKGRVCDRLKKLKQKDEEVLEKLSAKEAENGYFKYLPLIRKIAYQTLRRFRPQNASASSSIFVENKERDIFSLKTHDFTEGEYKELQKLNETPKYKGRTPKTANLNSTEAENTYSTVRRKAQTSTRKYGYRNNKSFDIIEDSNIYFRTTQNVSFRLKNPVKRVKRTRYHKSIDTLINRCKEVELQLHTANARSDTKSYFDKVSNKMGWAVKEYLANISGSDWQNTKNINLLLNIKDAKQLSKRTLFDSELVDKIRNNMTKRSLLISSLGRKKIWKPQRYIPSRQVVLANSIEELNSLYRIEGTTK